MNSKGQVKLCDFGVSGQLDRSLAKTNIGCQSYMAVSRILNPFCLQKKKKPIKQLTFFSIIPIISLNVLRQLTHIQYHQMFGHSAYH